MEYQVIEGYSLSAQQQRLWQLDANNPAYRVQRAYEISGGLDQPALERALGRLLERHEILRTAFRRLPGLALPLQVIVEAPEQVKVRHLEWSSGSQLLTAARELSFDFEQGEVLHACVAVEGERAVLVLSISALCADVASVVQLGHELEKLYEAEVKGASSESVEVMQYADYAAWQEELASSEEQAAGREYWEQEQRVAAAGREQQLVSERATEEVVEYRPQEAEVKLSEAVWNRVAELGQQEGVSISEVVEAGWMALVWRLSGEDSDVVIETGFNARKFKYLQGAIGNYET
ncbi:MAG TPA: condensation domain-containing protein, partial [Pyrinomonadaceae bacterium]|nr:condensation domain-containing protein [Pyrinomonadaceae bacterium]